MGSGTAEEKTFSASEVFRTALLKTGVYLKEEEWVAQLLSPHLINL